MVFLVRTSNLLRVAFRIPGQMMSTKPQLNLTEDRNLAKEISLRYLDGKDNGIVVLGLNRPEARNAFGKRMVGQLREALASIHQDDKVRVLILRSLVPNFFCAGADLKARARMTPQEAGTDSAGLQNLMTEIETISAPVIAALDGIALGGGLEMALACDLRTAALEAKMGLVETKLAIIPGAGGTQRLPRIIGPAKAKEMIFTAKIVDGREAHELGMVNRVVPQNKEGDAAYQAALHIAREILPNGPIGVRLAKKAISKGIQTSIEDGLKIERQCYNELLETEDRIEGLAAFASKRVPVYRGQ